MMKRLALAVALLCSCLSASLFAADKMSLDEAIEKLKDSAYMYKIRTQRDKIEEINVVFKDLAPEAAAEAAKRLAALLPEAQGSSVDGLARAFQLLGEPSVSPLVAAIGNDQAWPAALRCLPYLQEHAVPPVTALLTNENEALRRRAAQALGDLAYRPGQLIHNQNKRDVLLPAVAALGNALRDKSTFVALDAAEALGEMRWCAAPAVPDLAGALTAESPALRAKVAESLGTIGKQAEPALPSLTKALSDENDAVRLNALQAISAIGNDTVGEQLALGLKDSSKVVALRAAELLGKTGAAALPAVEAALKGDPAVQRVTCVAVANLGQAAAPLTDTLVALLKSNDELLRANVVDALAAIGEPSVPHITAMLDDASPVVRHVAIRALASLNTAEPQREAARSKLIASARPTVLPAPPYAYQSKEFQVGGPLEGVELPLFPTKNGEEPGHPGCVPELQKPDENGDVPFGTGGQQPEWLLYPGAVEHYRAYWMKYVPVRFIFDQQSQIKNFLARDLPGVKADQVEQYAAPLYWVPRHAQPKKTALTTAPVPVVRCKPDAPVFQLDFGTLPPGTYAVRVIGAVPTEQLIIHRKPLRIRMTVNDRVDGGESSYTLRLGYCDEFYSVAEIYFHAPETRQYRASLAVAAPSQVDLLVHNITLDDALAGVDVRPIKKAMTLNSPDERANTRAAEIADWERRRPGKKYEAPAPRPIEEQWARDEAIWQMWPETNTQLGFLYGPTYGYSSQVTHGVGGDPAPHQRAKQQAVDPKWGTWKEHWPRYSFYANGDLGGLTDGLTLLSNDKLNLTYTMADLAAGRPLPDPYPYKDDGTSLYFEVEGGKPQYFTLVADAVTNRVRNVAQQIGWLTDMYHKMGDIRAGRDAAMLLIRAAYESPTIDGANALAELLTDPGSWGRDLRCRRRETVATWSVAIDEYDRLFDLIQGNEELARSVHRFIPWINSSADLVAMLDGYLVQHEAKRILRYNKLLDNVPTMILQPAIVLADAEFTRPWLEWLWSKAYIYPNPTSGLPDLINTANGRDGAGYIASWFYCMGEEASKNGDALERYIAVGGDPKYDLRDAALYPKVTAATYWPLRTLMAGLYFPRIGDVCGPDKYWKHTFNGVEPKVRRGWKWTKDAPFAWMIVNHFGRKGDSDAEWAEIERAAATVKRAPYLTTPSRVVANWFGSLEAGQEYDDPRFRRNAWLRIGTGWGHHHHDTLDLQIHAQGYPLTVDGGQRPGYSKPPDRTTRVHNLVEVDGKEWMGAAWVRSMADTKGARYMLAEAVPPPDFENIRYRRRQIALIDVSEGAGARPVQPGNPFTGTFSSEGIVPPNSYVVDVARMAGGKLHTYMFHGSVDDLEADGFSLNVTGAQPFEKLDQPEQEYLRPFMYKPELYNATGGDAPETVVATWRLGRHKHEGNEQAMNPLIWDADSPRKYTRIHVLGQTGARALTGYFYCRQWDYGWKQLFVQRRSAQETECVFPAVIEGYTGEPFVAEAKLLDVAANETDASKAVAIAVKTTNGHSDMVFADGRPDKIRAVGNAKMAGEFAYVSTDADGLRQATLTGGTLLQTPDVAIKAAASEYVGTVTKVDYLTKHFEIDAAWPAFSGGEQAVEIGKGGHHTTYMAVGVTPQGKASTVQLRNGAVLFANRVVEVNERDDTVYCALRLPFVDTNENGPLPGMASDLVVSNRDLTKFWRAEYLGGDRSAGKFGFKLDGDVSMKDFGPSASFRVWEYGVGDTARIATHVNLRRIDAKTYELSANVPVEVTLAGKAHTVSLADLNKNNGIIHIVK